MPFEFLNPIIRLIPQIKKPIHAVPLKEKVLWTLSVLLIYFVMYHIFPIGVIPSGASTGRLEILLASKIGSIITVGIGPIVLASIFLQLLIGSKIIEWDLSKPENQQQFHGVERILALILCFVESAIYTLTGYVPTLGGIYIPLVILQLALGSILLIYMDELVSKYGIGSGISLFIAAGVSLNIVDIIASVVLPDFWHYFTAGDAATATMILIPIAFTIIVFLVVVYAESMRLEIPLSFGRVRGASGRYPIKFMYVSNIPVILASALIMNIQLWTKLLNDMGITLLGEMKGGQLVGGFAYYISPTFQNPVFVHYDAYLASLLVPNEIFHVFVYIISMVILCVIFGVFWVETAGMSSSDVANQLERVGFQIPGFRRDPRVIRGVLDRYIPTITILSSIFVGLLASLADLTGAIGTGTGILLTVSILHNFYEQLASQQMFEIYPALKGFVE